MDNKQATALGRIANAAIDPAFAAQLAAILLAGPVKRLDETKTKAPKRTRFS